MSLPTPTTLQWLHLPPGTIVHPAHGIARVQAENKNIVLLLLKIVKFVKNLFDLIIYTINTLNEWLIFDRKLILCSSADRRKCLRLLGAAFSYKCLYIFSLCGINWYGWFAKNALSIQSFCAKLYTYIIYLLMKLVMQLIIIYWFWYM